MIHQYLNAGEQIGQKFELSREDVLRSGLFSSLLSNIMLNKQNKELERRDHKFIRYADDFLILFKSKGVMESITNFIEEKLFLNVNREKSQAVYIRDIKFLDSSFYKYKGRQTKISSRKHC